MEELESFESGWKEREAEQTLIPWLLRNAADNNRSAALDPARSSSPGSTVVVPHEEPSIR
jgi:hypothetical protein